MYSIDRVDKYDQKQVFNVSSNCSTWFPVLQPSVRATVHGTYMDLWWKSLVLSVVSCNSFMKQLSHIIDQDVASVELGLRVLGLHVIW